MSSSLSPERQREVIFEYLERERGPWMKAKRKDERDNCLNREFSATRAEHMVKIDQLLEALVVLELVAVEDGRPA
jgi:hypothetical protein